MQLQIANRGSQHIRFDRITVKTASGFSKDLAVWYVLPGATRVFQIELPREECLRAGSTDVVAVSEHATLMRNVTVRSSDCQ